MTTGPTTPKNTRGIPAIGEINHAPKEGTTVTTSTIPETPTPVKILILQRGWVVVGRYTKDGQEHVLKDAAIVRRWGTSSGLGEIALGGPTSRTTLDKAGTVRAHELATVLVLDCDAQKWTGRL
jgi:flagellar basal body rod protein FlgF